MLSLFGTSYLLADYTDTEHRALSKNAIAVRAPGSYAKSGATYMLMQNIGSPTSGIFLGKDTILDLNGFTITYAEADYLHIPNYGFEQGLVHWDTSGAPGARIEETAKVQVFIGDRLLRLPAGEEIVSTYISLPLANRSYFAMCGVASHDMRISLYVEDETSARVVCKTSIGDSTRTSCPVENKGPRLGGGFVIAHLHGLPAGRYRLRIKAVTDCLIDHADIRPAMDVGIGIISETKPFAHHDDLYSGTHAAFFDYTVPGSTSEPVESVPRVEGAGTIIIRNGVIKSGVTGILSWGVQSTAEQVSIVLENVKIGSSGINANAVDVPFAQIRDCLFDITSPFIINRHVSEHAVVLRGSHPSEVASCQFFGGQGCLTINGKNSLVHDNLFVNRQTVTNHYSIMAAGDGSKIFRNRFHPEIGSGVEIFRHKNIEIFDNEFRIKAAPPTCEYGHEEYSTTAIRVADYGAEAGSERGCADNRIYGNRFLITGMDYPEYPGYIPMAWAFFHSASGGDTYIYDNDIVVDHRDPNSKAEAAALYVGGANNGGFWYNNRITSNVPAIWLGTPYGSAHGARITNNSITIASNDSSDISPVRMGFAGRPDAVATGIEFRSNTIQGVDFAIDATNAGHSYSVYWTLTVHLVDENGQGRPDEEIKISDKNGKEVIRQKTDKDGRVTVELLEYTVDGELTEHRSPYTLDTGTEKQEVILDRNREITLQSGR
jgi:hypothetical protein